MSQRCFRFPSFVGSIESPCSSCLCACDCVCGLVVWQVDVHSGKQATSHTSLRRACSVHMHARVMSLNESKNARTLRGTMNKLKHLLGVSVAVGTSNKTPAGVEFDAPAPAQRALGRVVGGASRRALVHEGARRRDDACRAFTSMSGMRRHRARHHRARRQVRRQAHHRLAHRPNRHHRHRHRRHRYLRRHRHRRRHRQIRAMISVRRRVKTPPPLLSLRRMRLLSSHWRTRKARKNQRSRSACLMPDTGRRGSAGLRGTRAWRWCARRLTGKTPHCGSCWIASARNAHLTAQPWCACEHLQCSMEGGTVVHVMQGVWQRLTVELRRLFWLCNLEL